MAGGPCDFQAETSPCCSRSRWSGLSGRKHTVSSQWRCSPSRVQAGHVTISVTLLSPSLSLTIPSLQDFSPKSEHHPGFFWKHFEMENDWPLLSWLYLHVLCVMIQRESIGHCILKIRIGILLLGNLATPINLCLTNPLKMRCSGLQLSPRFQEWQQMLQCKHLY